MVTLSSMKDSENLIDQNFNQIANEVQHLLASVNKLPSGSVPPSIEKNIQHLSKSLDGVWNMVRSIEEERGNLEALAQTNKVINSSLELNDVLQIVMDTIIRLTSAERGFLMLRSESGKMTIRVARNWEQESLDPSEFAISSTVINRVANEGQPVLTTNAQEDPRFTGQQSVVAYNLRSILSVPLKVKEDLIGLIYTDSRIRSGLFAQKDLDLLSAFANQAAVAIENARLFVSVRKTLAEVTALKNLMDNVFESIASGVLTTDLEERVMLSNRASAIILGQLAKDLAGKELDKIMPGMAAEFLEPYLKKVLQTDQPVVGLELSLPVDNRREVDWRFNISPLKDGRQTTHGFAIVIDDLTEKKALEAQRRLFERMVSPAVINHLDPDSLPLGGQRCTITTLFADIRGFTSFSESVSPEELVKVLNRHLAAAAEAVLFEDGTIDKFLGDAIMAWFNAPVPQEDHALRAVRAALSIRSDLQQLHMNLPEHQRLSFGIGIHTGDAVLGLVGTEKRLDYTAIGDSVNTAKRIQENSAPGQILISHEALTPIKDLVRTEAVDLIHAKGKKEPLEVYQVLGLT